MNYKEEFLKSINKIAEKELYKVDIYQEYLEVLHSQDEEIERLNNLLKETSQMASKETVKSITLKGENEELKDKLLSIENERDILKSKLSDTKADIHYLLEKGENIYIRNKYKR